MANLTKKATKGMMWSGLSQMTTQILSFTVTLILARLLVPEDFGLIGMSSIFIGVMLTFNELGLSSGIIQSKSLEHKQVNACFWISLIVGVLLCIFTLIASPSIASFFNEPRLDSILKVLSFIFVLGGIGVVPRSLLIKDIQFKGLSKVEIVSELIADVLAITLAFSGFGVWSLVFKNLILNSILMISYWVINPWRPSFNVDFSNFKEIFRFSSNVMGTNIINYILSNLDNIFIGKILGALQLGFYSIAFNMTTFPMRKISNVVTIVIFPVFSKLQDENEKLRKGYLKTTNLLTTITFPIVAGLFVISPEFVIVLLGQKWSAAIAPLQILCLSGLSGSITVLSQPLFLAKGRADLTLKLNIVTLLILAIAIYSVLPYGIVGVAFSVALVNFIMGLLRQIIANKLIHLPFIDFIRSVYIAIICSLLMLVSIVVFKLVLVRYLQNDLYILVGSVLLGLFVYLLSLRALHKTIIKEIIEIIQNIKSKG